MTIRTRDEVPIRVADDHATQFPGATKLSSESVLNLVRATWLVEGRITALLRSHGLSMSSFNVLMILDGDTASLCPSDIGERLLVTRGTVTGLLDSLEKQGLIHRVPDPEDRRMLRIELSAKARAVIDAACAELFPLEVQLMGGLSEREQDLLVKMLAKIQQRVYDLEELP